LTVDVLASDVTRAAPAAMARCLRVVLLDIW
jgi:hypothetical protein